MEPLDSEEFENTQARNEAYRNANKIKSNILKLVHIFRRDDMLAKLQREFREVINRPQQNEIASFYQVFQKTQQLWQTKLSTSLEEHNRMVEQVETSSKRVKELSEQLKVKKDNLDKYLKESKEAKEQARLEIEALKKGRQDLTVDKYNMETQLATKGQAIKEASEKRHQDTMAALN